jgi:hypothetical protein
VQCLTEFERQLVKSFNTYFKGNGIKGIAFRLKQHRFTHQYLDVIVDSLHPDYYLGIECKSISTDKGAKALYFTQHFTTDKQGSHQVDRMSEYLRLSGRKGFLDHRCNGCSTGPAYDLCGIEPEFVQLENTRLHNPAGNLDRANDTGSWCHQGKAVHRLL